MATWTVFPTWMMGAIPKYLANPFLAGTLGLKTGFRMAKNGN